MCEHSGTGTEVFNLGQNNLSLVPEFPFSLVISKMREVSHEKHVLITLSNTIVIINVFVVIIMIAIIAIIYIGEPDQCSPKPWPSKITVDPSGRRNNPVHPQNQ